jgi:hypothetical protein
MRERSKSEEGGEHVRTRLVSIWLVPIRAGENQAQRLNFLQGPALIAGAIRNFTLDFR